MLPTVFAEHFGIRPSHAHAVQVGSATGLAMTIQAARRTGDRMDCFVVCAPLNEVLGFYRT
jgi:hypothetical protein